jgi:molybdenum cofactor synthesis domain-containing protein
VKKIKTTEAVGHVLCHDITQIIPEVIKDARFRKGHIVTIDDIPVLLSLGKDHLFVWEKPEGMLHENEAAEVLCSLCINEHITASAPKEGKITLFAATDGLLKVDVARLDAINSLGEIVIATRHSDCAVKKGDKLASMRVVPLVINKEKMDMAVAAAQGRPLLEIRPFRRKRAGIVVTGNEVYYGRIKDAFGPAVHAKLSEFDAEILGQTVVGDDPQGITQAVLDFIGQGCDVILCTGGMSVDPDDATPAAIKNTGARLVAYGAPVMPGAMFLLAYYQSADREIPIMGLPGCVMYARRTVFDLVLPRVMADEKLSFSDIARLGHGGLCLTCESCTFPNCGFGK